MARLNTTRALTLLADLQAELTRLLGEAAPYQACSLEDALADLEHAQECIEDATPDQGDHPADDPDRLDALVHDTQARYGGGADTGPCRCGRPAGGEHAPDCPWPYFGDEPAPLARWAADREVRRNTAQGGAL